MTNPKRISKIDIAKWQLDRAIRLFLDQKDFVSSITLAGASEEILGSILRTSSDLSSYDQLQRGFYRIVEMFQGRKPCPRTFNDLANGIRNGLKHYQDGKDIEFDPEQEAMDIIQRSISNLFKITGEETVNMTRFKLYTMNRGNGE